MRLRTSFGLGLAVLILYVAGLFGVSASHAAPCKQPTDGMICVPEGKFERTSKAGGKEAIHVKTFYLDKTEVSVKEYLACLDAGGCIPPHAEEIEGGKGAEGGKATKAPSPKKGGGKDKPSGIGKGSWWGLPTHPITRVTWYDAIRFCAWKGKRLPTEAEWERAAKGPQGSAYPWGEDKPTCKEASFRGCKGSRLQGVSDGKSEGFGTLHLAGNVSEWVADWYAPCLGGCKSECGAACQGRDPKGPCQGDIPCPDRDQKVMKGGSYGRTADTFHTAWRSGHGLAHRSTSLGFRCASDRSKPRLPGPPVHLQPRPVPPTPTKPLEDGQKKLFWESAEDVLADKKLCPVEGRGAKDCRDPRHYVTSNEKEQYLWRPYIQNLGGAFVGIGADQNYTFIAWARSEMAWLMDYDAVIPWVHKLHRVFLRKSETSGDFIDFWSAEKSKSSAELLKQEYASDPDRVMILRAYLKYRAKMHKYFSKLVAAPTKERDQHWLAIPEHFRHIRDLYRLDRIRPMPGDLLKEKSLRGAAEAAKKMGVVVRLSYLSNAEEFWHYPAFYRKTFEILPMDQKSLVIRTLSDPRWGSKHLSYWHYNIQHGLSYRRRLSEVAPRGYLGFRHGHVNRLIERFRIRTSVANLSLIEMPTSP